MISFDSDKAKTILKQLSLNLQDYVRSAKTKDEQAYCASFMKEKTPMGMIVNQPLGGSFDVYRTRLAETLKPDEDITNPATFSYIPKEKCTTNFPKLHRCNFSGQTIFYASLSMHTNFVELGAEKSIGQVAYCAKWHVKESASTHVFRIIPPEGVVVSDDYQGFLKIPQDRDYPSELIDYLREFGSIMMNTEGTDLEKYLPCALLSNYIFNFHYEGPKLFEKQDSVYHGLIYPSVKNQDRTSLNFAFTPEYADNNLKLQCVFKGVICDDLEGLDIQEIGFNHNNIIIWYKLVHNLSPFGYIYFDKDDFVYDVTRGRVYDLNHKEVKDPYSLFYISKDTLLNQLFKVNPGNLFDINSIEEELSFKDNTYRSYFECELNGWTLEVDNEVVQINRLRFYYKYFRSLEKI